MPYLVQYRYSYKQKTGSLSETVQVTLFKKSSEGVGTPVITELIAGDPAFKVNVIDNDKNKFKPVRGKQATLIFKPQTGITASTFSTGPDDEWIVEALAVSTGFILFKGFLVMDDHQQSFLPVSHQYDIELTATDNLGTLKEVLLTDDSGNYIRGYKTIIDIISTCLRKTNLQLDIIVRDSWMEESQTTFSPACDVTYLQMKSFEKSIGEAVDCYTALEMIFGYRLSIKQYNGAWWIENIDEKTSNDAYLFRFDYTGAYIEQLPLASYIQTIGKTQSIKLINKDALLTYVRPYKYVKLNYNYEYPIEILDNIDFSRGTFISFDSGTLISTYTVADWTLKAGNPEGSTTPIVTANIEKKFADINQTYEIERYVRLTFPVVGGTRQYIESNPITLDEKDKFTISVDFKLAIGGSINGANTKLIVIRFIGDDGTRYVLARKPADLTDYNAALSWVTDNSSWDWMNNTIATDVKVYAQDLSEWQSTFREAPGVPQSGNLYVQLSALNQGVFLWDNSDILYSNLQFNYIPYINGAYSKYSGQSNKVEQSGNYKANIDERIYTSDSPKRLFKGAMFKLVGGKYVLTERWFAGGDLLRNGDVPPYPPTDDTLLNPFGHLQVYAVWNQYNRRMIELSGTAKGLKLDSVPPDLIDTYKIDATTDAGTEVTGDKEFMCVGMEQDYKIEEWSVLLAETYDLTIGKDYATPLSFKYEGGNQ